MKFYKIPTVDLIKHEYIKSNRQTILISKRLEKKLKGDDIAKTLGISEQAYSLIELNDRSGSDYMPQISSILNLSQDEIKSITEFTGNLVKEAKKYALNDLTDNLNETLSIVNLFINSYNYSNDIRYASAVYLSLFFNVDYEFKDKLSKPVEKNSILINEYINNWLIENFSELDSSFEIDKSNYFSEYKYYAIKNVWDNKNHNYRLAETTNNYDEIVSKINSNFELNKTPTKIVFKSLIDKYDVKEKIINDLGISSSYYLKLRTGEKPITKELINKMLLALNNITPTNISLLLGNTEQEIVSAIYMHEYDNIDVPGDILSICASMKDELTMLYDLSKHYNEHFYKAIIGNPIDYVKFQLFLSFYGIKLEVVNKGVRVSNNDQSFYEIKLTYKDKTKTINYSQLEALYNSFIKFNNKFATKFARFLARQKYNNWNN